jgi:glucose-6-phosphate isomerase
MYSFADDYCFSDKIGENGIHKDSLPIFESKIKEIFNIYSKTNASTKFYKILFNQNPDDLLKPLIEYANSIKTNFEDVIYVGMGGAILNPQCIVSLKHANTKPRVHFLYITDPLRLGRILEQVDLKKTAILVISKSGETTETIALFSTLRNEFDKLGIKEIKKHFFFILGENANFLRNMATDLNCIILPHDDALGGRFSGFSSVGFLPGLISGLNMEKFIMGMNSVTEDLWTNRIDSLPVRAALSTLLTRKPISAIIGYSECMSPLLTWYSQIIAESLGKDGKGITPVWGIGPNEQHSLLQLYLDGPKDKVYTLINIENQDTRYKLHSNVEPNFLENKTLAEINGAEFRATVAALKHKKSPVREIIIDKYDEFNLGAIMLHFAIEVITIGHMMNINPFDQPGVELIKIEARNILSK